MSDTEIDRLIIRIMADASLLKSEFAKARATVQQESTLMSQAAGLAQRGITSLGSALGSLRNQALLTAGVTGLGALVKRSLDWADALNNVARASNQSVERIQVIRVAARDAGLGVEGADQAMENFARNLGEFVSTGAGPAADAFRAMKVTAADAPTAFNQFIDGLSKVQSAEERSTLAAHGFGKAAGPEMAVLARQGIAGLQAYEDELRRTGGLLSAEIVAKAVDAKNHIEALGTSLRTAFYEGVINGFTSKFGEFANIAKDPALRSSMQELGKEVGVIAAQIALLAKYLPDIMAFMAGARIGGSFGGPWGALVGGVAGVGAVHATSTEPDPTYKLLDLYHAVIPPAAHQPPAATVLQYTRPPPMPPGYVPPTSTTGAGRVEGEPGDRAALANLTQQRTEQQLLLQGQEREVAIQKALAGLSANATLAQKQQARIEAGKVFDLTQQVSARDKARGQAESDAKQAASQAEAEHKANQGAIDDLARQVSQQALINSGKAREASIMEALARLSAHASDADKERVRLLAGQLFDEKLAAERVATTKEVTAAIDKQIEALQHQATVAGLNDRETFISNELLKAEIELRKDATMTADAQAAALARVGSAAAQAFDAKNEAAAMKELSEVGQESIKGFTDALVGFGNTSETVWQRLGNAGIAALARIQSKLLELTVANPLENLLFDTNKPTLSTSSIGRIFGIGGDKPPGSIATAAPTGTALDPIYVTTTPGVAGLLGGKDIAASISDGAGSAGDGITSAFESGSLLPGDPIREAFDEGSKKTETLIRAGFDQGGGNFLSQLITALSSSSGSSSSGGGILSGLSSLFSGGGGGDFGDIGALSSSGASAGASGSFIGYDGGGLVRGVGGPRDDRNLALLSDKEFVVNADATAENLPLLVAINSGRVRRFADGGIVDYSAGYAAVLPGMARSRDSGTNAGRRGSVGPVHVHLHDVHDAKSIVANETQIAGTFYRALQRAHRAM